MTTESESAPEVLYDVGDSVATITFNRPERQNTISPSMLDELTARLVEADEDPEVRAVILTGSGRFFCAGLDLRGGLGIGGGAATTDLDLRNTPPTVIHAMGKPTIAALNGSAAGYGMDMALGCDIRIMARSAKLAAAFTARGIVPESGGTWILPRLIGWAKASELIFTGKTLTAEECLEERLCNHVVDDGHSLEAARGIALEIARNAPLAVQASKKMMRMGLNETFPDHVHHVFLQLLPLMRTKDFKEGMSAFMEKRPAEFKGK